LKQSLARVVSKRWFLDGGCGAAAVGLTGCLRLEVVLAFLVAFWVEDWPLPLCLVSTIFRVRKEVDEG